MPPKITNTYTPVVGNKAASHHHGAGTGSSWRAKATRGVSKSALAAERAAAAAAAAGTSTSSVEFSGETKACSAPYPLYTQLDVSYGELYTILDTSMTDIINNGTLININQLFFNDMSANSRLHPQLLDSSGTLIVKDDSKTYIKFTSDVTFNPEPFSAAQDNFYDKDIIDVNAQYNLMHQQVGPPPNGAPKLGYALGWFAAMSIFNTKGTVIDLNGHTFKQSELHNLQQRFYANIELASAPFDAQGPATFGGTSPAQNVYIKGPGTIALSAHHGIHGTGHKSGADFTPIENVLIENVTFENYEIAGVHLNGFKNVIIKNCTFKNQRTDVPVRAPVSAVNFLKPYINAIADISASATYHYGDLGAQTYSYYKERLKEATNAMYEGVLGDNSNNNTWNDADSSNKFWYKLFANTPSGAKSTTDDNVRVTDGVAYGIVANPWGVAVNGFPTTIGDLSSQCLFIKDTSVNNLFSDAHEIPGIAPPVSDASANYPKYAGTDSSNIVITKDPIGVVMSPFQSYTKYNSASDYYEECLNLIPLKCSGGNVIAEGEPNIVDLRTYLPFAKPRVDNSEDLITDPSNVHFNPLLVSELIVDKNKDQIWAYYNDSSVNNFRLFDISKGVHNPAYDDWAKGKTVLDASNNWCNPYSTEPVAADRTYENSFRSSFHYLTGLSDINQSYNALPSTPFSSYSLQTLSGGWAPTWKLQQDASSNVNSKVTLGGDFMAHVSKPAIGLKLDGTENVYVSNVKLKNITEFGRPGFDWNGNYKFGQPFATYVGGPTKRLEGYNGASTIGVTLSSSYKVAIQDLSLINLHSSFSETTGIDSMWEPNNNKIHTVDPIAPVSGIHYYSNNKSFATSGLYTHTPTPEPRITIYKKSTLSTDLSHCDIEKPASFGIPPFRTNANNLLLSKYYTPPKTW